MTFDFMKSRARRAQLVLSFLLFLMRYPRCCCDMHVDSDGYWGKENGRECSPHVRAALRCGRRTWRIKSRDVLSIHFDSLRAGAPCCLTSNSSIILYADQFNIDTSNREGLKPGRQPRSLQLLVLSTSTLVVYYEPSLPSVRETGRNIQHPGNLSDSPTKSLHFSHELSYSRHR